jgi:hypothetical protein
VVLSGNRLTVENFTARAGGGSAQINGGATLTAFRPTEWRFEITAKDAEALWRGVRAAIDANLTLTGTPQGQTISPDPPSSVIGASGVETDMSRSVAAPDKFGSLIEPPMRASTMTSPSRLK